MRILKVYFLSQSTQPQMIEFPNEHDMWERIKKLKEGDAVKFEIFQLVETHQIKQSWEQVE